MKALTAVFNDVKKTYFPKWKTGSEWRVVDKHPILKNVILQGICLPEEKVIVIHLPTDAYVQLTLAHEICHAVTGSKYHDKKWRDRFTQVANRAEQLGQIDLAHYIRKDMDEYRDGFQDRFTKGMIEVEQFIQHLDERKEEND